MFISFEGIEGSGKSTQIKRAGNFLEKKGIDCCLTREPGGTDIGRRIRSILLDPRNVNLDPLAELLLYMADRAQHLRQVVKPVDAAEELLCAQPVLCAGFEGFVPLLHSRYERVDVTSKVELVQHKARHPG